MSAVMGYKAGGDICAALGINPAEVTSLTLHFDTKSAATVTVERYVRAEDMSGLVAVVEQYSLVPIERAP